MEIGRYLLDRVDENFASERSPTGNPWKALAPMTVAKRGSAHPILDVSGGLERSFIFRADDSSVEVGTNRLFPSGQSAAAIHQKGGRAGRGVYIPARPMVGANERDKEYAAGVLMRYIATLG